MDNPHFLGWVAFSVGFIWRILDEFAAKLLFRLGAVAARWSEREKDAR
jgi:hypothetical protein